jgi:hypothetical protein
LIAGTAVSAHVSVADDAVRSWPRGGHWSASGAYDGMGETFEQLDEVLVTLGAKGGAS